MRIFPVDLEEKIGYESIYFRKCKIIFFNFIYYIIFLFQTPLHVSSEHGFLGNVRLLLSHGADLVARDCNGLTPLDLAEKCDHAECMYLLKETAGKLFHFINFNNT